MSRWRTAWSVNGDASLSGGSRREESTGPVCAAGAKADTNTNEANKNATRFIADYSPTADETPLPSSAGPTPSAETKNGTGDSLRLPSGSR